MSTEKEPCKECRLCGEIKPLSSFGKNKKGALGRQPRCKTCMLEYHQEDRIRRRTKLMSGGITIPSHKECCVCKQVLPAASFYFSANHADGLRPKCKPCFNRESTENSRQAWLRSRETKTATSRNSYLKATYGITTYDYEEMLKDCGGKCEICKSEEAWIRRENLCVDHNHRTGAIRGLLCASCNRALGCFQDSEELLRAAIEYLKKYAD